LKRKLDYGNPLTLALEWQRGLEEGRYSSKSQIAKEYGVSRARVTQVMNLLKISPALLNSPLGSMTERKIKAILKGSG